MKHIKVLGPGCARCTQLAENVQLAARDLGLAFKLEKVTNLNEIAQQGIMRTPGLIVDGQVKSTGKLLSVDEVKALLG